MPPASRLSKSRANPAECLKNKVNRYGLQQVTEFADCCCKAGNLPQYGGGQALSGKGSSMAYAATSRPAAIALRAFGVAALLAAALVAGPARSHAASPNDTARILAGLPVSDASPLAPLMRDPAWQLHRNQFDAAFRSAEQRQLSKMRAWSAANMTAQQGVLFYMFSGPDFLHANAFFPDAGTYVLAALEPTGAIPDLEAMPRGAVSGMLGHLRGTLRSSLAFTFFITREMREELGVTSLRGTLPILYVYLARSGKTIREVALVHLDRHGNVLPGDSPRSGARGARIVFAGESGRDQTLYYFTTNLANDGFRRSGFAAFCESLGIGDSFLKSASYLPHQSGFSQVRDFLLERSATILQDDSGIPLARFDAGRWAFRTYGRNVTPIDVFPEYHQPRLKELHARGPDHRLDFGFGYRHRPHESSLFVATARDRQRPVAETSATTGRSLLPADAAAPRPPEAIPPTPRRAAPLDIAE